MGIPNIILLPGLICSVFIVLSVILYQQIACINKCTQNERLCQITGISFQKDIVYQRESPEIKDSLQMRDRNTFLNFVNSTKRYRISNFNINNFKIQDSYIKCYNINNKPSLDCKCVT